MKQTIVSAFLHILKQLAYVLFIMPIDLWKAALKRLAQQHDSKALTISEIKSPWPIFSFIKRWIFEFLFDLMITILPFVAIYNITYSYVDYLAGPHAFSTFGFKFKEFIYFLLSLWYVPYGIMLVVSLLRDLFTLLLMPFRKFLSWVRKPAQHLDLTIDKEKI